MSNKLDASKALNNSALVFVDMVKRVDTKTGLFFASHETIRESTGIPSLAGVGLGLKPLVENGFFEKLEIKKGGRKYRITEAGAKHAVELERSLALQARYLKNASEILANLRRSP